METGNSNNEMRDLQDPLTGGSGDDAASQSSQRSGASLLERIRAQRSREAAASAGTASSHLENGGAASTTPSTIQVPQYSQIPQDQGRDASFEIPSQSMSRDSFFTQAWTNISHSMETGMASLQQERTDLEAQDALLPPTVDEEENYSMIGYFTTFVRDVYETFLNLPLWVRIIVVFALLFTAWKLI